MIFEQRHSSGLESAELSVVILTYNARSDLALCLASLCEQTVGMSQVQVVIVDDGSADATAETVMGFSALLNVDYYVLEHTGVRGMNRNFGVSKAAGKILLLLDGDMILSRDFLEKHLRNVRESKLNVSMGKRRRPFRADESFLTPELIRQKFEVLEGLPALDDERLVFEITLEELGIPHDGIFAMVFSHNICLWKESFLAVGGFDERFSKYWGAEDVELGYRLAKHGCRLKLDGGIIGYHLFRNDDIQKKLRQLKMNLAQFREKHRDWESELASVEHLIWPYRYLRLRQAILTGGHFVAAKGAILDPEKRYLSFGVDLGNGVPARLGLFAANPGPKADEAFVSGKYRELGDQFFARVLSTAFSAADRVTVVSSDGKTLESLPPEAARPGKKLIVTVSDTNFGGKNKSSLYRLGLALNRRGVKIGFSLAGDILENRPKFSAFGDIENPGEQHAVMALYDHDLHLDEDAPNLMDGVLGGGIARSVDRRIHWQENFSFAPDQGSVAEAKAAFSRIIAKRSSDKGFCEAAEAIIPMGVSASALRRHRAEVGDRVPGSPTTLLWICPGLDELSGFTHVLHAFDALGRRHRKIALRAVIGTNGYSERPEYLNPSSWHMVRKANDHQLERERRLLRAGLESLEERGNISILSGNFGEEFLTREVMKADIVVDTSPLRLMDPWLLAAYAARKRIVRFADDDYADHFDPSRIFPFEYQLVSGVFGDLQFEFLAHGNLNQARYNLYKRPQPLSFEFALERAVIEAKAGPWGDLDEAFLDKFDWDVIAERFACLL